MVLQEITKRDFITVIRSKDIPKAVEIDREIQVTDPGFTWGMYNLCLPFDRLFFPTRVSIINALNSKPSLHQGPQLQFIFL